MRRRASQTTNEKDGRELTGRGRVKGGMLKAHVRWVTDHHSPSEVEKFWEAVPEATRTAVGSFILDVSWYAFADLMAIDRAIIEVFGDGDDKLARDLGRYSAQLNLTGTYKAYRRAVAHEYCERSARVHSSFQDFGSLEYRKTGETSCEMIHSGYSSYSPLFCKSALGYYEEAITLNGGLHASVRETTCQCRGDAACTFVLTWSEAS
ncbi:MAG: hypothetical protein ABI837_14875 [Acidobacteriota bacterium]